MWIIRVGGGGGGGGVGLQFCTDTRQRTELLLSFALCSSDFTWRCDANSARPRVYENEVKMLCALGTQERDWGDERGTVRWERALRDFEIMHGWRRIGESLTHRSRIRDSLSYVILWVSRGAVAARSQVLTIKLKNWKPTATSGVR